MTQIRTEKEMFPLVEDWLKSGITQKEFSHRQGLPLHILPYWVAKYRKVQPTARATETGFIELTTPQATVNKMEMVLPSGAVIRFSSLIPLTYLHELLSLCSH